MAINYEALIEIRDNRNGSWYWVHTHVLRDNRLSASEKVIYSTIASYTNQHQTSYPSIKRISKDSGIAERHVYRCLKKLEKLELISVKRQAKQGKNNIYTLLKTLPVGGGDMMSGVTNRHQGGDIKTVGGDDKSTLLTKSNITTSINNNYDVEKIITWAYERARVNPSIERDVFTQSLNKAIQRVGYSAVYEVFAEETNAISFLTRIKSL